MTDWFKTSIDLQKQMLDAQKRRISAAQEKLEEVHHG